MHVLPPLSLSRFPPTITKTAVPAPHRARPQKMTTALAAPPPLLPIPPLDPITNLSSPLLLLLLCQPPSLSPLPPSPLITSVTSLTLTPPPPPHTITSFTTLGHVRHRALKKMMMMMMKRGRVLEQPLLPVVKVGAL